MSYLEQSRQRNPATVAAVIGAHLAIGYALLSGLAYEVIRHGPTITTVEFPVDPPPPQPHKNPPPKAPTITQSTTVTPQHPIDTIKTDPIVPIYFPPIDLGGGGSGGGTIDNPPIKASQARDAIPDSGRLSWITTEDYPASLIRENVQGTVAISTTIGTDGKVRSCLVTQSSGNRLLDDTTCRLYTRRAHFTPARDADGNPTSAQRSDRFRWQIPNQ
ncbi:MAG TPA: energy transducer TonB [Sphingomonas sp.]|uniref:energy transducer TonB n=1 Tax=Sphingomonas sp. TaxID=28214 RepID=UPI002C62D392|nr:energy transducer TonB [Sphingomonas sp.]HMI21199.1 energy transducer TonB [Sphingomonas sp.]